MFKAPFLSVPTGYRYRYLTSKTIVFVHADLSPRYLHNTYRWEHCFQATNKVTLCGFSSGLQKSHGVPFKDVRKSKQQNSCSVGFSFNYRNTLFSTCRSFNSWLIEHLHFVHCTRDILVRIRGYVPLTNESGFGSWSVHQWPSRRRQKVILFLLIFSAYYGTVLFEGTLTLFFKDKKS